MKKWTLACALLISIFLSGSARATLTDLGNGLVYDSVNNISWIQNAASSGPNNWQAQVDWANNRVLAGFDDFQLASIGQLQSLYNQLIALNECSGSNCTGNPSPFTDVQSLYWSGTEVAGTAWVFGFGNGAQFNGFSKGDSRSYGWAVRPGDSVGVPEPGT